MRSFCEITLAGLALLAVGAESWVHVRPRSGIAPVPATQAAATQARGEAIAEFIDSPGDRIRSDGRGAYEGGSGQGVLCRVDSRTGSLSMRTLHPDQAAAPFAEQRHILLQLGDAVGPRSAGSARKMPRRVEDDFGQRGTLNLDGLNILPDFKILTGPLYGPDGTTGTARVSLAFNLERDLEHTAFLLVFKEPLKVTRAMDNVFDPNLCMVHADDGSVAELYRLRRDGGKHSLGSYRLSFRLRVERLVSSFALTSPGAETACAKDPFLP